MNRKSIIKILEQLKNYVDDFIKDDFSEDSRLLRSCDSVMKYTSDDKRNKAIMNSGESKTMSNTQPSPSKLDTTSPQKRMNNGKLLTSNAFNTESIYISQNEIENWYTKKIENGIECCLAKDEYNQKFARYTNDYPIEIDSDLQVNLHHLIGQPIKGSLVTL